MSTSKATLRSLRRNPTAAVLFVAIFALIQSAVTPTLALLDRLVLRPLAVPEPDRLVVFGHGIERGVSKSAMPQVDLFSYENFRFLNGLDEFAGVAASSSFDLGVVVASESLPGSWSDGPAMARFVSGNYFGVFGVAPRAGRFLTTDDEVRSAHVAVVADAFVERRCQCSASDVIGRDLDINGERYLVVGVAPATFQGESVGRAPDLWVPITIEPSFGGDEGTISDVQTAWLHLVGRVAEGRSVNDVQVATDRRFKAHVAQQPSGPDASELRGYRLHLGDGRRGFFEHSEAARRAILAVGSIELMLAIAGASTLVALCLLRLQAERQGLVLRAALGGRVRHVLVAAASGPILLCAGGALLGLLLTPVAAHYLTELLGERLLSLRIGLPVDLRMLALGLAVSLGLAITVAASTVLYAAQAAAALRSLVAEHSAPPSRWILHALRVQLAILIAVAYVATLVAVSAAELWKQHLGIDRQHVAVARIAWPFRGPEAASAQRAELPRIIDAVRTVPGIVDVAFSSSVIFGPSYQTRTVRVPGARLDLPDPIIEIVTPGYFNTLRVPIIAGRLFEDPPGLSGERVVVVNREFSETYFGSRVAVGSYIDFGTSGQAIVLGVVDNVRQAGPGTSVRPIVYAGPWLATNWPGFVARTQGNPSETTAAISRILRDLGAPAMWVRTVDEHLARLLSRTVALGELATILGWVAAVFAAASMYALLRSYNQHRAAQLLIRVAVGARPIHLAQVSLAVTVQILSVALPAGLTLGWLVRLTLGEETVGDRVLSDVALLFAAGGIAALVGAGTSALAVARVAGQAVSTGLRSH